MQYSLLHSSKLMYFVFLKLSIYWYSTKALLIEYHITRKSSFYSVDGHSLSQYDNTMS